MHSSIEVILFLHWRRNQIEAGDLFNFIDIFKSMQKMWASKKYIEPNQRNLS